MNKIESFFNTYFTHIAISTVIFAILVFGLTIGSTVNKTDNINKNFDNLINISEQIYYDELKDNFGRGYSDILKYGITKYRTESPPMENVFDDMLPILKLVQKRLDKRLETLKYNICISKNKYRSEKTYIEFKGIYNIYAPKIYYKNKFIEDNILLDNETMSIILSKIKTCATLAHLLNGLKLDGSNNYYLRDKAQILKAINVCDTAEIDASVTKR